MTPPTAAVLLLAAAGAVLVPLPDPAHVRFRRLQGGPRKARLPLSRAGGTGAVLTAATLALLTCGTAVGIAVAAGGYGVLRTRARSRAELAAVDRRQAAVEVVAALAAELRAGRPPEAALACVAEIPGPYGPTLTEASATGAIRPTGDPLLARLAAAWRVSESSGAPLAGVLDQLEEELRAAARAHRQLRAQLAGPKASARLLAVLPLLGLLLGAQLGADPRHLFAEQPAAAVSLLIGVGLDFAGLAWIDRITRPPEWP
ncbi:MAG: type II secretion system F family protein [Mycobacteriales bacterium]